jgi:hypothetical protein
MRVELYRLLFAIVGVKPDMVKIAAIDGDWHGDESCPLLQLRPSVSGHDCGPVDSCRNP